MLAMGSHLGGSTFRIYQDLLHEIAAEKRKQLSTFEEARKNNVPAAISRAQPDK